MIRRPIFLAGTAGGFLYLSHLVVDLLTRDQRPPMGLPLLWPVSQEYFVMPVTIFPGISHGNGPTGMQGFLEDLLAWSNVYALGLEFVVLLPLAGGVVWWRRQFKDASE